MATSLAMSTAFSIFPSDLGWMALLMVDESVVELSFAHATPEQATSALRALLTYEAMHAEGADRSPALDALVERLQVYARGARDDFRDVPIALDDTAPFTRRVIAACRAIDYGQTRTYGQLAAAAGSPRAARAVGNAMRSNRVPLIVPCHRVIGSTGHLHGYSAGEGLRMKLRLLELEGRSALPGRAQANPRRAWTV